MHQPCGCGERFHGELLLSFGDVNRTLIVDPSAFRAIEARKRLIADEYIQRDKLADGS